MATSFGKRGKRRRPVHFMTRSKQLLPLRMVSVWRRLSAICAPSTAERHTSLSSRSSGCQGTARGWQAIWPRRRSTGWLPVAVMGYKAIGRIRLSSVLVPRRIRSGAGAVGPRIFLLSLRAAIADRKGDIFRFSESATKAIAQYKLAYKDFELASVEYRHLVEIKVRRDGRSSRENASNLAKDAVK